MSKTDIQTNRQTNKQTNKQTDKHTDRQTDIQTDRHLVGKNYLFTLVLQITSRHFLLQKNTGI